MRSDGETFVDGLPRSKLRDVRRKLTFVPAGHVYHDEWHEPRVLTRVLYLYFDPPRLPTDHETNAVPSTLAARLFFKDPTLPHPPPHLNRPSHPTTGHRR